MCGYTFLCMALDSQPCGTSRLVRLCADNEWRAGSCCAPGGRRARAPRGSLPAPSANHNSSRRHVSRLRCSVGMAVQSNAGWIKPLKAEATISVNTHRQLWRLGRHEVLPCLPPNSRERRPCLTQNMGRVTDWAASKYPGSSVSATFGPTNNSFEREACSVRKQTSTPHRNHTPQLTPCMDAPSTRHNWEPYTHPTTLTGNKTDFVRFDKPSSLSAAVDSTFPRTTLWDRAQHLRALRTCRSAAGTLCVSCSSAVSTSIATSSPTLSSACTSFSGACPASPSSTWTLAERDDLKITLQKQTVVDVCVYI